MVYSAYRIYIDILMMIDFELKLSIMNLSYVYETDISIINHSSYVWILVDYALDMYVFIIIVDIIH